MKKIRIGNDIEITWSVFADKEQTTPYTLAGRSLTLKCSCDGRTATTLPDFSINGNAVVFTFYGKDQERTGVYTLTLVENEGLADMHTVDSCDAFQLVARSCDVDGDACGCGNVEVESVELTSTLSADVVANYPSLGVEVDSEMSDTSENPVQNKVVKTYIDDALSKVMPKQNEATEGNVAVFDAEGNAVDSGKSVEDFKGADGKDGADGVGVPAGGSAGQVLSKKSDEDFDTEWVDAPKGGGEVKVEDVTDANGKPLDEILSEISAGGAEGALIYNAPQTLTDEQKSQVAKNIGQPRERLILEWSNEDAEVLQPIAYDTESSLFEVATMPSYLAEDGVVKQLQMNYDRSLFLTPDNWKNLPKPQGGQASWFFVKREDATHFSLWQDKGAQTAIVTPSTIIVEKFYLTQGVIPYIYFPKYEEGLHKYRLVAEHTSHVPSRYNQMAMLGQKSFAPGRGSTFYELGTDYQSTEVVDGNFEIEIEIDHTTYQNRFVSIKGYCTQRDNNSKLTQLVNRPLFGPWTDFSFQQRPNFIWAVWPWAIKKDTTIKLYEIVE